METSREQEIIGCLLQNGPKSISEIQTLISEKISIPTLNRALAELKKNGYIEPIGNGPSLKYHINLQHLMTFSINQESFFQVDTDNRKINERFDPDIIDRLKKAMLFSKNELELLSGLQSNFQKKIKQNSATQFTKEFERLMIELSWKSSQIEGNTYDLLDTEQFLKHQIVSKSHSKQDTQMLLNHKEAINYTFENKNIYKKISVSKIIDIHTLLTQKMGISKNLRKRIVRITGTKYLPPDNEFIIQEALENLCKLVNSKSSIFEKAFLTVLLISYIQPFEDGNKRTARLTANAILMNGNACPLSYRSINPSEYKKAILLFYELNNISAFKNIFINQYKFAVENYF
jgi:Fic family protein